MLIKNNYLMYLYLFFIYIGYNVNMYKVEKIILFENY